MFWSTLYNTTACWDDNLAAILVGYAGLVYQGSQNDDNFYTSVHISLLFLSRNQNLPS